MDNGEVLVALYITISCVAFVASKIIIAVLLYKRWKKKHAISAVHSSSGGKMVMFRSSMANSMKKEVFLEKTKRLTSKDILGSGGYGTVYKLEVDESTAFAVKRLHKGSPDGDKGFERELEAMGDIKHRNIVTLHGYYTRSLYNLLIYEMHNLLHSLFISLRFSPISKENILISRITSRGNSLPLDLLRATLGALLSTEVVMLSLWRIDIQKMEKFESQSYDDLADLNPSPVSHMYDATNKNQNDDNNYVPHDHIQQKCTLECIYKINRD